MKPNFRLHPNDNVAAAITRIYKNTHAINHGYQPNTQCAVAQRPMPAKPVLRIVK